MDNEYEPAPFRTKIRSWKPNRTAQKDGMW